MAPLNSALVLLGLRLVYGAMLWDDMNQVDIPLRPELQNVRGALPPPRPLLPRHRAPTIELTLAASDDAERCGRTVFSAFQEASNPDRVFVYLVHGHAPSRSQRCRLAYCALAAQEGFAASMQPVNCPYEAQLVAVATPASSQHGTHDFCATAPSSAQLATSWDNTVLQDWLRTENEFAIVTSIAAPAIFWYPGSFPHACVLERSAPLKPWRTSALPSLVHDHTRPLLAPFLAPTTAFAFGKCHARHAATSGDVLARSAALWARGYDFYSAPSKILEYDVNDTYNDDNQRPIATPEPEATKPGARPTHAYLDTFLGLNTSSQLRDASACRQLYWVPFTDTSHAQRLVQRQSIEQTFYAYPPSKANEMPSAYVAERTPNGHATRPPRTTAHSPNVPLRVEIMTVAFVCFSMTSFLLAVLVRYIRRPHQLYGRLASPSWRPPRTSSFPDDDTSDLLLLSFDRDDDDDDRQDLERY
ncbi:hypothetical protein SDRG_03827 [Saprolegnia diclina VS20]|uniref:Uncharacterized protein n=1 Tax=Saprolegnia diclina (strain VS20) TaxID=1156394 RepID=T0QLB4_SAPDV|nr:hypothetical protein SDRG_03827 [Saprolegnia diclina VS20]EQC38869.1 hypothetical protein SDRG_03827 [Saprolegnia diclina VS20]|eukprot:XP_008607693.1 hypothetical protein SDRG_03827 [Saprolegnia diclina VS20]